jgi:serine O-acetyltransferase
MIYTFKDLKYYLHEDAKRNGIHSSLGVVILKSLFGLENACVYRYLLTLRLCEYFSNCKYKKLLFPFLFIFKIRRQMLGRKYGISVRLNTCGYGLRINHLSGGGGVIIEVKKAGNYCSFNSGVLIGNNRQDNDRPSLGDYVSFGPGAKAFGSISIGSHVFVAANAVVTKDIPEDSIIGGIPATIIKKNSV